MATPLRCRGFTLLELMVVLVMIGVIISMAVLSIGDGGIDRRVEQEGRRIIALLDLAADEAVLAGREHGLYLWQQGYQIVQLVDGAWLPNADDPLFRQRSLPPHASLRLTLDGLPVALDEQPWSVGGGAQEEGHQQDELQLPQLYLFSSGERTLFEMALQIDEHDRFRVASSEAGVVMERSGERE